MKENRVPLPSKKSIEEAIHIMEGFRDVCKHQLGVGYWATTDFPSKHHINKILQIQYAPKAEVEDLYGAGLTKKAYTMIALCKSYLLFLREEDEDKRTGDHNQKRAPDADQGGGRARGRK